MTRFRNPKKFENCVKEAMIAFWDRIVFEYPELDKHDLPDVVKHNFPVLCMDAADRYLKHAEENKKEPANSDEFLYHVVEELNMLANSQLLTKTSYQLISDINKHLERIKP